MSKTYMVIERFRPGQTKALYEKFDQEGRLLPPGVEYLDSWIDETLSICFQLMRSESIELLEKWTSRWDEFAEFEIYPIISSDQARAQTRAANDT